MNPSPPPKKAPTTALPAMNDKAAKNGGSPGGVTPCKLKTYFAVMLYKVDEKDQETPAGNVTLSLKITELGDVDKVTADAQSPVMVRSLTPGGKGDVLQMTHDTDVYEAIGDFQ